MNDITITLDIEDAKILKSSIEQLLNPVWQDFGSNIIKWMNSIRSLAGLNDLTLEATFLNEEWNVVLKKMLDQIKDELPPFGETDVE